MAIAPGETTYRPALGFIRSLAKERGLGVPARHPVGNTNPIGCEGVSANGIAPAGPLSPAG